ncbi:MAG: DNA polymerase III subunit gamma/tau [Phycisphaerae bacterium]
MAAGYTVLARRYRSQNFDQLIGQEAIAKTLKNAVATGRLAHAFLFTGTRGVGKTSSARILAKAINCPNSVGGQPCGECPTCKAIAAGEDIDVIEIDGASNNGVEQIRDLRQSAGITPSHSTFKIYIIDEVHMLTMPAFNALLKTLEEPPPHVKFIFATTDVHKVPATILSRCQRYDFKNIPAARITEHLVDICKQENAEAQNAALHRIAILAAGSMRDALSLLDRVLSLGAGRITEKLLDELLGKPSLANMTELTAAMAAGDAAAVLKLSDQMLLEGMSTEQVLSELTDLLRNLMVLRVCGTDTDILDIPGEWRGALVKLAPAFDAAVLVHHIALCDQTLRSLRGSTMPRPLFDALMVRLAMAGQFSSIRQVLESGQLSAPAHDAQKKNDALTATANPAPAIFGTPSANAVTPENARPEAATVPPRAAAPISLPAATVGGEAKDNSDATWQAVETYLTENQGASLVNLLNGQARILTADATAGLVRLEIPGHTHNMVRNERYTRILERAVAAVFGKAMRLEIIAAAAAPASAATSSVNTEPARPAAMATPRTSPELIRRAQEMPAVQQLMEKMGAKLVHVEAIEMAAARAPAESE